MPIITVIGGAEAGALIFKGSISTSADFPDLTDVVEGWTYRVLVDVTDNDPAKTNTGQAFSAGDDIAWNGTDWSDLGPGVFAAAKVTYDNSTSEIASAQVQAALDEILTGAVVFSGNKVFESTAGIITRQAETKDAFRIQGRAGGTSSFVGTATVDTLTASRTYTFPDSDLDLGEAVLGGSNLTTQYRGVFVDSAGVVTESSSITTDASGNLGTVGAIATCVSAGGDSLQLSHDGTDAYFKTDDGSFIFQTDEGTNTNTYLYVKGKGTGYGASRLYDQDDAEYLETYISNGSAVIRTQGASPSTLSFQQSTDANIYCFFNSAEGLTQEFKIFGYRTGDARRSLSISVGASAADQVDFTGLSTYSFDGQLGLGGVTSPNLQIIGSHILIGPNAGDNAPTGFTVAIGSAAMKNTTSTSNVAVGYQALGGAATGGPFTTQYTTCVGYDAGRSLESVNYNCFFGYRAGSNITTGLSNIAIGANALLGDATSKATGNYNIVLGYQAMVDATSAGSCIVIGAQAGLEITTGSNSVAIGYSALRKHTTTPNLTAVGHTAGAWCTGAANVFYGYEAGKGNAAGATGAYNTCIGYETMEVFTTGANDTCLGYEAGALITEGDDNVLLGYKAGYVITTGSDCVIIGSGADPSAATTDNEIVIGKGATGQGANTAVWGGATITDHYFGSNAASGATPTLNLSGYRTGDALRTLSISVGASAADQVDFTGLSTYHFDGDLNIATGGVVKINSTQVVGAQGAAVADAANADATDLSSALALVNELKTQLNATLARVRAHGLIAT